MFTRKSRRARSAAQVAAARAQFVRPHGLIDSPKQPLRTVQFVFDEQGLPGVSLDKVPAVDLSKTKVDLSKAHMASQNALVLVGLNGIRIAIIVIIDGSYSMQELYIQKKIQELIIRTLGFALNVDDDGKVPSLIYSSSNGPLFEINLGNFQDPNLLVPVYGSTAMTEAFEEATRLARQANTLAMVINFTDGGPDNQLSMKNAVIAASAEPILVKNVSLAPVAFLDDLDDMPSIIEVRKDADGKPIRDVNDDLILDINPAGVRFLDLVDSQDIDPFTATDDELATAFAEEINEAVEVMARAGILTGVPGYVRDDNLLAAAAAA